MMRRKNIFDLKKITYLINILTIFLQFISSTLCSIAFPRQLGLSVIFISFFSVLNQFCQFEGSFLYLSRKIEYKSLIQKSTTTALIFILLFAAIFTTFCIKSFYVTAAFFNQFVLLTAGLWFVDLINGKKRILNTKLSEKNFQKAIIKAMIIFGIIPNVISSLILQFFSINEKIWSIYSIILFFAIAFLFVWLFISYFKYQRTFTFSLPTFSEFSAPIIKRSDTSAFIFFIGIILGPTLLGTYQPAIKIAKSTHIITPIFLKMNFMEIERKIKKNLIFPTFIIFYFLNIILGITVLFFIKDLFYFKIDQISIILFYIYFASANIKSYQWALNYKIGNLKNLINFRAVLLILKISIFVLIYFLQKITIINNPIIIGIFVFPEILLIFYFMKQNMKHIKT